MVIVGPDMSRIRWMKLLSRFGLAERSSTGKWKLLGPIKSLFSKSEGIQLDDAGLARIADLASANPGGLFLFDSYTKLTSKLGLKEAAEDAALISLWRAFGVPCLPSSKFSAPLLVSSTLEPGKRACAVSCAAYPGSLGRTNTYLTRI